MRSIGFAVLFSAALVFLAPQAGQAATVTAVECSVNVWPCPVANVIDVGIRNDGVAVLPGNTFDILPFVFTNADVTFTGTMMATNILGGWIYNWGSGTATDTAVAPPPGGFFLDVAFQQTYLTIPGPAVFNDMIQGTCAGGPFANTGVVVQGVVNGTPLSVLGPFACGGALPFLGVGAPVGGPVGLFTTLTGLAQFFFDSNGTIGQSITLPWGNDFPDLAFNFDDPNNPLNFFTPDNFSADPSLVDIPEPGSLSMIGGALCFAGLLFRRKK
jgi:hypothetical protein